MSNQMNAPAGGNRNMIIGIVVAVVVLCCCCAAAGAGYYLWINGDALFGTVPTSFRAIVHAL